MFIRRVMVSGAPFVCSVESTRLPVSAALMAISAVSKSRISPTKMMLGSCRRKERNAAAKFKPICSFIWTWLTPCNWNSTGSSAVMMLVSGWFKREIEEYRVFVLPDPVGPVTSTMPYGFKMAFSNLTRDSASKPSLVMSRRRFSLSSSRSTIFSPHSTGSVLTRKSSCFLRPPLFADVQLRHDLETRSDGVPQFHRRRHDGLQHAVNTETHTEFFFVRLDVNIAGAAFHRIAQNDVHQLDDRSLVGSLLQLREPDLRLFCLQFDVFVAELVHRLHNGLKIFFLRRAVSFVDAREN